MSGALKHFFDQIYYPCLDATVGRPFGFWVHGNDDTTGAVRAIEVVTTGLRWRLAQAPVSVVGSPSATDVEACWELGASVSAMLAGGLVRAPPSGWRRSSSSGDPPGIRRRSSTGCWPCRPRTSGASGWPSAPDRVDSPPGCRPCPHGRSHAGRLVVEPRHPAPRAARGLLVAPRAPPRRRPLTVNATRLRQEGVSVAAAERGVGIVAAALASDGPSTRAQLGERLAVAGVPTAGQALVHLLVLASLQGSIVRGPVVGREQAFASGARLGRPARAGRPIAGVGGAGPPLPGRARTGRRPGPGEVGRAAVA